MNANETRRTCDRGQQLTDQLWRHLLPLAGPQALRIFLLRTLVDRSGSSPWMRHLRFGRDGRPMWGSIEPLLPKVAAEDAKSAIAEVLSAVAVKAVEQFGGLPERVHPDLPPQAPTRRAA